MNLSVVISSYNRDDKVLETLNRLFDSDLDGIARVEVLVIDDGSPRPVKEVLARLSRVPDRFELKLITQENRGIGATRNRGFRDAGSDIIVFLDDDILVREDTLREIAEAHRKGPGPIIFGGCPFISHASKSLEIFIRTLNDYDRIVDEPTFERVDAMISGILSVNRAKLKGIDTLYCDDMTIPAAEEIEAVSRFSRLDVPLYRARHLHAIHNHHLELEWLVQQQYKYGMGMAEALSKSPESARLELFGRVKKKMDSIGLRSPKGSVKFMLSSRFGRRLFLSVGHILEKLSPDQNHNKFLGLLTSTYYWAGYREGQKRFQASARAHVKQYEEVS